MGIKGLEEWTVGELAERYYRDRILPRHRPEVVRYLLDHDILPLLGHRKLEPLKK